MTAAPLISNLISLDQIQDKPENRSKRPKKHKLHGQNLTFQQNCIRHGLAPPLLRLRMKQTIQTSIRPVQMIRVPTQSPHHGPAISPPQHGDQETQKLINDVTFVKILQNVEVSLRRWRKYEGKKGCHGVYRRHPQYGQYLALDGWLVHFS